MTDERFTSRTKFISSDYLLDRVGYDPAQVPKRLGDGFYEQRLVREQVLKLTGRPHFMKAMPWHSINIL